MRFITALIIGLFVVVAPTPSGAATPTPAQVAQTKTIIENYIKRIESNYGAQGIQIFKTGDYVAEAKDNYIAIKTPALQFENENGDTLNMGVVALNAVPKNAAGQVSMSVAYPNPMVITLKPEKPGQAATRITINIGQQSTSAIYDETVDYPTAFKSTLGNITFTFSDNPNKNGKIDALVLDQNYTKNANNLFSGPFNISLKNIVFSDPDMQQMFKIAGIDIKTAAQDIDFKFQKAFEDRMTALQEAQKSLKGNAPISPQHGVALYNTFVESLTKGMSGFTSQMDVTGMTGLVKNKKTGVPETFGFNKIGFGIDMTNLKTNASGLNFRMGMNGFKAPRNADAYGIQNPETINVDVKLKNLPLQELIALGGQMLQASVTNPENAQIAGLQALLGVPAMLTQAKTGLDITDVSIASPEYTGKLTGAIVTNAAAVNGVTAKMLGRITGLDGVLEKLKAGQAQAKTPEEKQNLTQAITRLTTLQAMGQQGADGARTYDIQVTEQGKALINGADFSVFTPQAATP